MVSIQAGRLSNKAGSYGDLPSLKTRVSPEVLTPALFLIVVPEEPSGVVAAEVPSSVVVVSLDVERVVAPVESVLVVSVEVPDRLIRPKTCALAASSSAFASLTLSMKGLRSLYI